jgi:hypothetical protein
MTCPTEHGIYAEENEVLQLNAGVELSKNSYQVEFAPKVNNIETLTDLTGYTGSWVFKDDTNSVVLNLTTENGGLIFNANNTIGLIYPYATANQITAMAPRSNKGMSRFTIFDSDGEAFAGSYIPFRWIKF